MKKPILTILLGLAAGLLSAQSYSALYEDLPAPMAQVEDVVTPGTSVSLLSYGAVGDGLTLNTKAFEDAIKDLRKKGGGTLVVPLGIYLTGPFVLRSDINLHLERGAVILSAEDKALHTKDGETRARPLVSASKCENISITGEGTIDGNGARWRPVKREKVSDWEWKEYLRLGGTVTSDGTLWMPYSLKGQKNVTSSPEDEEALRADLVRFTDCKNVLLKGVTFQNSPRFHVHPVRCENVTLDGITVRCPWNAQNGDAIDLSNCRRVLVTGCIVDAGDDGICMKGGTGSSGVEAGPCEDILIQDNTVYHAHGGFVIGSDVSGGMKNIVVRRCLFSGTDVGLRFKSGIGRGGETSGIRISDIVMTDIKNEAIMFECTYIDRKYNYVPGEDSPAKVEFAPDFRDIDITRVTCHNAATGVRSIGLEGLSCVKDIHISNSTFLVTRKETDIDSFSSIQVEGCTFRKLY